MDTIRRRHKGTNDIYILDKKKKAKQWLWIASITINKPGTAEPTHVHREEEENRMHAESTPVFEKKIEPVTRRNESQF